MNTLKKARLLALLAVSSTIVSASIVNKAYQSNATYEVSQDINEYYSSISDSATGDTLLSQLRSLNSIKRKSTVGYGNMGTSASGKFKYTDYDPETVQYDSNNQPYGTKILSFYSSNSCTSFNREHVWPNSHGGDVVENDIHMPRPTIPAENGSRGNSFYVEGMKHSSNGWDPAMESFGVEDYRGDSARIVFYCVIANSKLSLLDQNYHATSRDNNDYMMGKLSDLLKWNLKYPVLQREYNRNNGAEYLQGNRNPFIDHPEYACKIWGNTNDTTRQICKSSLVKLEGLSVNSSSIELTYDGSYKLSVTPIPSDASSSVTYKSSDTSIVTVSNDGLVTAKEKEGNATITITSTYDSSISTTVNVRVNKPANVAMTSISSADISLTVNDSKQVTNSILPTNVYPKPTLSYEISNEDIASVSSNGVVKGLKEGETTLKIIATQESNVKECLIKVTVTKAVDVTETIDNTFFGNYGTDVEYTTKNNLHLKATNVGNYSNSVQFKKSSGTLYSAEQVNLKKIVITGTTSLTVYGGNSVGEQKTEINGTDGVYDLTGYKTFVIKNNTGGVQKASKISLTYAFGAGSEEEIDKISLNHNSVSLTVGDEILLKAEANKDVTWSSSNNNVASVSFGTVKALSEGTAIITAKAGNATATCTITVNKKVEQKTLVSLTYEGELAKTEYKVGEKVSLEGLKFTANYSDNTKEDVTNKVTLNKTTLSLDDKTISVSYSYEGITKTLDFDITVKESGNTSTSDPTPPIGEDGSDTSSSNPVPPVEDNNTNTGCGGNIVATSIILSIISLIGILLVALRKKFVE